MLFGHRELARIIFPVIDSEDEDPSLRSALLAVLAFKNPSASARRAAIEILDKLASVTGQ